MAPVAGLMEVRAGSVAATTEIEALAVSVMSRTDAATTVTAVVGAVAGAV